MIYAAGILLYILLTIVGLVWEPGKPCRRAADYRPKTHTDLLIEALGRARQTYDFQRYELIVGALRRYDV